MKAKQNILYIASDPHGLRSRARALEEHKFAVSVANYDHAVSRASQMTKIDCIIVDLTERRALQVYVAVLGIIHHNPLTIFETSMDYELKEFGLTRLAGHEQFFQNSGDMGPHEFAEEIYLLMTKPAAH